MDHSAHALEIFAEESAERLQSVERGLLRLEKAANAPEESLVNEIFRDAHSIKAGANLLKLPDIEGLAHRMENILDRIRRGEIKPTDRIVTILLDGVDAIKALLDSLPGGNAPDISVQMDRLGRVADIGRKN